MLDANGSTKITENTTDPVIDLNCGEEVNIDLGLEICAEIDQAKGEDGVELENPSELTRTFGNIIGAGTSSVQADGKASVSTFGREDGAVRVLLSDDSDPSKKDAFYFESVLLLADCVTALASSASDDKFSSTTFIHTSDDDGALLRTIQAHTSCSAPILNGDTIETVTLSGVGLPLKASSKVVRNGAAKAPDVSGVVCEITRGTNPYLFTVGPDTCEVSPNSPSAIEIPLDLGVNTPRKSMSRRVTSTRMAQGTLELAKRKVAHATEASTSC